MADVNIGYIGFLSPSAFTFTGGIMVCDSKGFPLEFRYSEPITPTKVQQVLYGNVLDKYIKIDIISESLIKAVTTSFNVLVTQDETVLAHKFPGNFAAVRIAPTKSPQLSAVGENLKIKDREFLLQASANNNPVRIHFTTAYNVDENVIKSTMESLVKIGTTMDIDEPISRVYRALELICQQTQRQD